MANLPGGAILLDAGILILFLLFVFIGHKRGFIKTASGLIAFIAAAAVAMLLSGPIAQLAYDKLVEPTVITTVEEHLTGTEAIEESVDQALNELPDLIANVLANSGITSGTDVMNKLGGTVDTALAAQSVADKVVQPIVVPLLKVICTLVLFILAFIAAAILLRVLNVVAKLPLLKQLNKGLGAVAGVLSGILWVLFAVSLLQVLAATGAADGFIPPSLLNDTYLIRWLMDINPIGGALQEWMVVVSQ